jgi:hypothetical protein
MSERIASDCLVPPAQQRVMQGGRGFLSAHRRLKGAANQLVRCPRRFLRRLEGGSNVQFDLRLRIGGHWDYLGMHARGRTKPSMIVRQYPPQNKLTLLRIGHHLLKRHRKLMPF